MAGQPRISRRSLVHSALAGAGVLTAGHLLDGIGSVLALADGGVPLTPTPPGAGSLAVRWNNAALEAVRVSHLGPPMTARALAMLHTAIYDAWAAYHPSAVGTQFGGTLRRPASEHTLGVKQQALSYAAFRVLCDLFPVQEAAFRSLMGSLGYNPDDRSTDGRTPTGIGNITAAALLDVRHHDGSNQLGDLHPGAYSDYTGYAPVNTPDSIVDPNHWQPLRISDGQGGTSVQVYLAPHWGLVTPFALSSGSMLRPAGPARAPSHRYRTQVDEIVRLSAGLSDAHKAIAEYWMDGPSSELPPGHWCLFAQFVCRRDGHSLDRDVQLFFALANAVFDAGIACWDAKRAFDSVRPITAVHYVYGDTMVRAWAGPGMGTRPVRGNTWQPYQPATVVTPPFPEYVSGHSTFSAAAAEVLSRFTGSDACGASTIIPPGTSRVEPGRTPQRRVVLQWPTFSAAAWQAGISRRYGGIHFRDGDLRGRHMGRQVGGLVFERVQAYLRGTARP